ncbi:hypothetical protein DdX_16948 [Ditylenchus destructor]|uniref:Uncharacterized protein n=1 Tax=Ditylenchus destructor TaxID=166010 RepID=A0AAD4MPG5_9BILA|nr:hypothetical protein DdX_16948 [Ditylenchus destructor]
MHQEEDTKAEGIEIKKGARRIDYNFEAVIGAITSEEERQVNDYLTTPTCKRAVTQITQYNRIREKIRLFHLNDEQKAQRKERNTQSQRKLRATYSPSKKDAIRAQKATADREAREKPLNQYKAYLDRHRISVDQDVVVNGKLIRGFNYHWQKLEERILGECLMLFCNKDEYPGELTDYDVAVCLEYLKQYGRGIDIAPNDLDKERLSKFEEQIIMSRVLAIDPHQVSGCVQNPVLVPFYQVRLELQPDIYRLRSKEGNMYTEENLAQKWEFITNKIRCLFGVAFPDLTDIELDKYVQVLLNSLFAPIKDDDEESIVIFNKINAAEFRHGVWMGREWATQIIEKVMPKRLNYVCPRKWIEYQLEHPWAKAEYSTNIFQKCLKCEEVAGNTMTIFTPKVYLPCCSPDIIERRKLGLVPQKTVTEGQKLGLAPQKTVTEGQKLGLVPQKKGDGVTKIGPGPSIV